MEFLLNNLTPVCVLIAMVFSVMLGIADYMVTKQMQLSKYQYVSILKTIRKGAAIPVVASIVATASLVMSTSNGGPLIFVISALGCIVSLIVWAHSFSLKEWLIYGCSSVLMAAVVFAGVSGLPADISYAKVNGISIVPYLFMGLLPFAILGLIVSYLNRVEQGYLRWAD